tara:strand:- start:546 stop:683 length:138 start_codon:yes stop_codon:yes gene_type:complete
MTDKDYEIPIRYIEEDEWEDLPVLDDEDEEEDDAEDTSKSQTPSI